MWSFTLLRDRGKRLRSPDPVRILGGLEPGWTGAGPSCMPPLRLNFVIAGVMRGGTTALAHFLAQHPAICMAPRKELHVFDDPALEDRTDSGEGMPDMAPHFPNYTGQPVVGEATPITVYFPEAIRRLACHNPGMKVVVMLRDPVHRALSHHRHSTVHGSETRPPALALLLEPWRLWRDRNNREWTSSRRCHSYRDRGFYGRQLALLLRSFPARQIHLVSTRALRERHAAVLRGVYRFLGVAEDVEIPPAERLNVFGEPSIPPLLESCLRAGFRRDQRRLARLIEIHGITGTF